MRRAERHHGFLTLASDFRAGLVWCSDVHEWGGCEGRVDPNKAASNLRKHGVRFAEAATVFENDAMLTMPDDESDEERFIAIGIGSMGRVFVVVYIARGDRIRIISTCRATHQERSQYESIRR